MRAVVPEAFEWRASQVPAGVPVRQVYGWLVGDCGRVLLQDVGDSYNLPGGRPERGDGGLVGTLVREAMEESQVRVRDAVYLGYELVDEGAGPVALVRMVGRIGGFLPRQPDPDGGRLLGRFMTSFAQAPRLLSWGRSGLAQAEAAMRVAALWWRLPVDVPMPAATVG
jgi:8-oxo-dGTP pyrophosphatase MutT (NUDIX family)